MSRSPSRLTGLLNHPHFWLWLGAGMFVVSLTTLWKPDLVPDQLANDAPANEKISLPVLSEGRVPQQPRLYPYRLSKNSDRPSGSGVADQVTPANHIVHPLETSANRKTSSSVVHADWETESSRRAPRVQQVSVSFVHPDAPAPAWLTGTIEMVDDSQPAQLTAQRSIHASATEPAVDDPRSPMISPVSAKVDPGNQLPLVIPAVAEARKPSTR